MVSYKGFIIETSFFLKVVILVITLWNPVLSDSESVVYPCTTPEGEDAHCISLFECPGLIKLLATLEHTAIKYFKQSICLGCSAGDFMVCCGESHLAEPGEKIGSIGTDRPHTTSNTTPQNTQSAVTDTTVVKKPTQALKTETKRETVLRTLIPARTFCGFQHTDDRYYNDSNTALDEYPWLVHIKFTDIYSDYKLGDRCTGVLINNRYVLTDTMCSLSALKVRLGQYNVAFKVTCMQNPDAHECSEGTIEVRVENTINLQPEVDMTYSLSLLRLANVVDYSDYVRPICLPLRETHRAPAQTPLTFSGWGSKPRTTVTEDAIKKRMVYNLSQMDVCTSQNPFLQEYLPTLPTKINCFAPDTKTKDRACNGDHGGPLMYSNKRPQWFVEHVVVSVINYGSRDCENTNALAVKITPEIINKILDNVQP